MKRLLAPAVLTALTLAMVTSGCSAGADASSAETAGRDDRSAEPSAPYRLVPEVVGPSGLQAGGWALSANGGGPDTVLAEVQLPAGYDGTTWFVGSDELALLYWLVDEVPRDPCRERGRADPGPSVADLVAALDQQRLTEVRRVSPVRVDRYEGTYLEIVAPDVDYSSCKEGQVWYWETPSNGARHRGGPAGAIEHVWAVDVDGQRVVLSAEIDAHAPDSALVEMQDLIETVRFVEP